jgi:catechol 2,3-dioxygenase-like lactoylglutathione lyase family enzyme
MITGIDHLVVVVRDLDAATRAYRALGFTVVAGGRHPVGTYNSLIAFGDRAYLELIGFYRDNPEHRWWAPLQRGGGLVDFCLETDDLMSDTLALRAAGVDIADPTSQSRVRPDGYQLRWVFSLARGAHRGVAPFLIRDETERDERVPQETRHANGVTGIGAVTVAVDDLAVVRGWYRQGLGMPGTDVARPDLGAAGVRFTVGPHALEFLAPRDPGGEIARWLAARGPSPYAATLRAPDGARGPLDPGRTMGARLAVEAGI